MIKFKQYSVKETKTAYIIHGGRFGINTLYKAVTSLKRLIMHLIGYIKNNCMHFIVQAGNMFVGTLYVIADIHCFINRDGVLQINKVQAYKKLSLVRIS